MLLKVRLSILRLGKAIDGYHYSLKHESILLKILVTIPHSSKQTRNKFLRYAFSPKKNINLSKYLD